MKQRSYYVRVLHSCSSLSSNAYLKGSTCRSLHLRGWGGAPHSLRQCPCVCFCLCLCAYICGLVVSYMGGGGWGVIVLGVSNAITIAFFFRKCIQIFASFAQHK